MMVIVPVLVGATTHAATQNLTRRNVLFIVADDFRPSSQAYGNKDVLTPHLDKLAAEGTLFTAAHVQFSYCAPSRNSFMSGRRPDATKVWNFNNHFREPGVGDEWASLPEHFVNSGYLVTGAGKLYHEGVPPNFDQPRSWSASAPDGTAWPYEDVPTGPFKPNASTACNSSGLAWHDDKRFCLTNPSPLPPASGERTYLQDEAATNLAVSRLRTALAHWQAAGQPFFVRAARRVARTLLGSCRAAGCGHRACAWHRACACGAPCLARAALRAVGNGRATRDALASPPVARRWASGSTSHTSPGNTLGPSSTRRRAPRGRRTRCGPRARRTLAGTNVPRCRCSI